ncbi:MAG: Lipopolysaccharide biosynthesis glycosyltransferase, partial [Microgenomates group bacterium GW2011_GWC1_38_12]
RGEIENRVLRNSAETVIYAIPRKNIILGRELRHGGWWPDYVKHLVRKNALKGWKGDLHEEPVFEGNLEYLKGALVHLKHDNLSEMVEKTNDWSNIEAKLMFEAKHPPMNILRFSSAMFREFWLRMIKQMAFLDGSEGIIYAIYQVYSRFISYAKLWEMQIRK